MKSAIIVFASVFVVSLIFFSMAEAMGFLEGPQPYPLPAGISSEIKECQHGVARDDFGYSEINIVDQSRPIAVMKDIGETGDRSAEFPTGANN